MVIGVDDALILAGIAAAGGAASYFGQQETNSANRQMNKGQMEWQTGMDNLNWARSVDAMREQYARNAQEAWVARDWADAQTKQSRDWTANMSNTAYQRVMQDMKAAGLNPLLAYQQGGASTPQTSIPAGPTVTGSAASAPNSRAPAVHRMENALGPAVSTAMQAANTIMGVQQAAASIDQTKAATELAAAQTAQSRTQAALNSAQTVSEAQRTGLLKGQRAEAAMMPSLRAAQTGATSAQGVLYAEQTRTQQEEQSLLRERGRETSERANLTREERDQLARYGRGSVLGVTPGAVFQPFRSAGEWIRQMVQ